jgi:hypothetical protein
MEEFITLNDGLDYLILDEIKNGDAKYLYLANPDKNSEFVIKKEEIKEGRAYLLGLQDEKEFELALKIYQQKNAYNC